MWEQWEEEGMAQSEGSTETPSVTPRAADEGYGTMSTAFGEGERMADAMANAPVRVRETRFDHRALLWIRKSVTLGKLS